MNAYDNVTKSPFNGLVLSTGSNSSYFKIASNGTILTKKPIHLPAGTVLQFFVFGAISGKTNYKHIKITVSVKNLFPPQFLKAEYRFTAYRYGVNGTVGRVKARDRDPEYYNRVFRYVLSYNAVAKYFRLNDRGEITLWRALPDILTDLKFNILAVDSGSPSLTGQTLVHITISEFQR